MTISPDIMIITRAEYATAIDEAFQKGAPRGRFEERNDATRAAEAEKAAAALSLKDEAIADALAPYRSEGVPEGYDTIIHFLSTLGQEPEDMGLKAGFKMRHFCNKHGLLTFKVSAPEALRAVGITEVNAYPLTALCEVL